MIIKCFRLVCDVCRREHEELFESEEDLLKYSDRDGWDQRIVGNGSLWEFCPRCKDLKEDDE